MYFSGKVTHSVISYLEQNGIDLDSIYSLTDIPAIFLRDPSHWLAAKEVEHLLSQLQNMYGSQLAVNNLCQTVGHQSYTLHSWGVLDSVLKMMMSPQDIFTQPQRFISYFVSPISPIGHLSFDKKHFSFELPISNEEYPLVASYLKASLEALPQFMKQAMANVEWKQNHLIVTWEDRQQELIKIDEKQLKPEFVQQLLITIENIERKLEGKNLELKDRESQIESLKSQLANIPQGGADITLELRKFIAPSLKNIQNQFMRLSDYLVRSQQLITLLVGQGREDKQVREAMKRVDWDQVQPRFTNVVQEGLDHIEGIHRQMSQVKVVSEQKAKGSFVRLNLDALVERAIAKSISNMREKEVQIDRMLFFDREVLCDPEGLEKAFVSVLDCSSQTLKNKDGYIRVITRPKGMRAEIEISNNGTGLSKNHLKLLENEGGVRQVIDQHKGALHISNRKEEGSTFLIDLPS